jgi:sugar lactone lactonase YvrE
MLLFLSGMVEQVTGKTAAVRMAPLKVIQPLTPDRFLKQLANILVPANNVRPIKAAVRDRGAASFRMPVVLASPPFGRTRPVARSTSAPVAGPTAIIRTFAGGSADGAPAILSTFSQPYDAALAPDDSIAIVDTYNNRIRRVDGQTGIVQNVAGSGDTGFAGDGGPATGASMNFPLMAAYGSDGSLYFTDTWNDRVRRVNPQTGIITTVAGNGPNSDAECLASNAGDGGPATSSAVCSPSGVAVDANGNLFIAETRNSTIRRVDGQTGIITTVAGNRSGTPTGDGSPPTNIAIIYPWGIVVDALGNPIVSDDEYRIRYINLLSRAVTLYPTSPQPLQVPANSVVTIAGGNGFAVEGSEGDGGPATDAKLTFVKGLKIALNGDLLLTEDGASVVPCPECPSGAKYQYSMLARRIDWQTGIITTIAGNKTLGAGLDNIAATQSALSYPEAALVDANGNAVVVDRGNSRLRTIAALDGTIQTTTGANIDAPIPAASGAIYKPKGVAVGPRGVYFTDPLNLRIRRVGRDGLMTTIAGSSKRPCVRFGIAFDGQCEGDGISPNGDGGPASDAQFYVGGLDSLSVSPQNVVAVVGDGSVRVINDSDQPVTLFPQSAHPLTINPGYIDTATGGGPTKVPQTGSIDSRDARLQDPRDVTFAPNGDMIIAERQAYRILRVDAQTGQVSVLAGIQADVIVGPGGIVIEPPVSFADGPLAVARFLSPYSVAAAPDGTTFYVADTGNNRIRKVDLNLGVVTTIAGTGVESFSGDGMPAILAELSLPSSIRLTPDGSIVFMDFGNQRVRKIGSDGNINTIAGNGPALITPTASATCADGSSSPCGHYSGDGGPATSAEINLALNLAVSSNSLFIADTANSRIRRVDFGVPLLGIASQKIHGNAGPFDVDLPIAGNPGIECRSGGDNGDYTLVFTFANPLTSVDGASVSSGTATVSNNHIGADPHEYIVDLTGVINQQQLSVSLNTARDAVGNISDTVAATMNILVGDTNADRSVNSADISQTKSQSGNGLTTSNFREDLNADGSINSADISLVKSKSGTALP